MRAVDVTGDDVAVVHADNPALAVLAGFDLVVNNADRKGSHVLPTPDGRILGVDHGLCFHQDEKLRTILWGWAGTRLPAAVLAGLGRLTCELDGTLGDQLDELITTAEIAALRHRIERLDVDARNSRSRPGTAPRSRGRRCEGALATERSAPAAGSGGGPTGTHPAARSAGWRWTHPTAC